MIEPDLPNGKEMTRLMWATPLSDLTKKPTILTGEQGMYMFGGINDENNFTDDFYWISCDIKANQKFIDKK